MERTPLPAFSRPYRIARHLSGALVSGPWQEADLVARGASALGRRARWLPPLARRLLDAFGEGPRPTSAAVAAFLRADRGFSLGLRKEGPEARPSAPGQEPPPAMWPAPGAPRRWPVPPITTPGALAEYLGLTPGELDWFADRQGRTSRAADGPLRHYRYVWRRKATGEARLIEAPRPRLKALQRLVLDGLLAAVPPHEAAHGFRAGRSVRTFAEPHAGRLVVLKVDLRNFFPTVTAAQVVAIFLTAGYPEPVARLLAGLCTSRVPRSVRDHDPITARGPESWRIGRLLARPHLPQGAPTSPALANLCAYRLDLRLDALAGAAGGRYTRYADDLVFSGGRDLGRSLARFYPAVCAVALEEGFAVNTRKTRVMRRGNRQRVAGVVVNDRPNVARDDFDRLKATLHNCRKHGPDGQNREGHADFHAHLTGRVAHVAMLNPERGRKLRAVLDAIAW